MDNIKKAFTTVAFLEAHLKGLEDSSDCIRKDIARHLTGEAHLRDELFKTEEAATEVRRALRVLRGGVT